MLKVRVVPALVCLLTLAAPPGIHAQRVLSHVEAANARTATRYMELAEESLKNGDWKRASDRAAVGLTYDDTISDLWYIRAYAEQQRASPPYIVVSYVRSAMESGQWIAGHRDAARLLYARLLADTGEPQKALALLDESPAIKSFDADFIRTESLYRIGTPQSRELGRTLAQTVLRSPQMGPWKEQFILLFFRWEILPGYDTTPFLQNIAGDYVAEVFESDTRNADLVLHAAAFAPGPDRTRILRWFAATGLRHPLYALFALDDALLAPAAAFDYFIEAIQDAGQADIYLLEIFGARLADRVEAERLAVEAEAPETDETNEADQNATVAVSGGGQGTRGDTPRFPQDSGQSTGLSRPPVPAGSSVEPPASTSPTTGDTPVTPRESPVAADTDSPLPPEPSSLNLNSVPSPPPSRDLLAEFAAFLRDFRHTLTADSDKDGIIDMRCEYEAGRPARISYDANQDGINTWAIFCDLGAPKDAFFPPRKTRVVWGSYPWVARVAVTDDLEYTFGRNTLEWSPLHLYFSEALYDSPGQFVFYVPRLNPVSTPLTERQLLSNAAMIRTKVTPTPNLRDNTGLEALFTLENGRVTAADYYPAPTQSGVKSTGRTGIYAHAVFENGIPLRRQVDVDGDGVFEREETYTFDPARAPLVNTPAEAAALYKELFGSLPYASGLFLSRVTLDMDGDALPNFTEEYRENGAKTSRWQGTVSGMDTTFTRYDSTQKEVTFRYDRDKTVIVRFEGDTPVALTKDGVTSPVGKFSSADYPTDFFYWIYWIGATELSQAARQQVAAVLEALPQNAVSIIDYEEDGRRRRIFLVAIGQFCFGELIDE